MKKVPLVFCAGYDEVTGGARYPKWDFKVKPELECVIMTRANIPDSNKPGSTYLLVTCIHRTEKQPYVFFCGAVLEDKMRNIHDGQAVKIVFCGKHPTKKYHVYKVYIDKDFRLNPAEFSLANYSEQPEAQVTEQSQIEQQQKNLQAGFNTGAQVSAPATVQQNTTPIIEDDLPF